MSELLLLTHEAKMVQSSGPIRPDRYCRASSLAATTIGVRMAKTSEGDDNAAELSGMSS